jgi:general secretion pathway protein D
MKSIKILIMIITIMSSLLSKEQVQVNFKNLTINQLIKMTANIMDENILVTNLNKTLTDRIEFITTKPIYKDELINILMTILDSKGYTLIKDNNILKVVRSREALKNNLEEYKNNTHFMSRIIIKIKNKNSLSMVKEINLFLSKSGKIINLKESNSLLIIDMPNNIKTINKVIKEIEKKEEKDIINIEIKNQEVIDIYSNIIKINQQMFDQFADTEKIIILMNKNTNSLILSGNKKNIKILIKKIKLLDTKEKNKEEILEVIQLMNNESSEIDKMIKPLISSTFKNKIKVTANKENNSLIVAGEKKEIDKLKILIKKLDKEKRQVLIQVQVIEISEIMSKQVGLKYGLDLMSSTGNGLFSLSGLFTGNSIAISKDLASFVSPRNITEGFALGTTLSLLKNNGAADIVSQPSLLCLDNKESSIYVGETQSILNSTSSGDNTTSVIRNTFSREDIGLTLKVKPRISSDKKVTIELDVTLEDILNYNASNSQPTTTKRSINTTNILSNGETVIIGGLIKKKVNNSVSKIPGLSDLPWVGDFFTSKSTNEDKINLVIMLTPYIIPENSNLQKTKETILKINNLKNKYRKKADKNLNKKLNEIKERYNEKSIHFNRIIN